MGGGYNPGSRDGGGSAAFENLAIVADMRLLDSARVRG